jgi:hypothetical protein
MNKNKKDITEFAEAVGNMGYTWCPATFNNGRRKIEDFRQLQIVALDFDSDKSTNKITWEDVKKRADCYNLPILFAYETFNSKDKDKFRVVFLNDVSVDDKRAAYAVISALRTIFPESDELCKDISYVFRRKKFILF